MGARVQYAKTLRSLFWQKGHLRPSGQKEATRRDTPERIVKTTNVTIEIFLCEYCGSRFNNTIIDMM
jgi:hypothetical protein